MKNSSFALSNLKISLKHSISSQCYAVVVRLSSPSSLLCLPCPGSDLLVRLVSVDLHTFGPDALTAVRLIEHQANAEQAAEVRPQLVEQVPAAVQGATAPGKGSSEMLQAF